MSKCISCNNEIIEHNHGVKPKFCSRKCYHKWYYQTHKQQSYERRLKWHKEHYIYHPKPKKYQTEEELQQKLKEYRHNYYLQHKEYYRLKSREWYNKHRDDPELKKKQSIAMQKYYKKKVRKLRERI